MVVRSAFGKQKQKGLLIHHIYPHYIILHYIEPYTHNCLCILLLWLNGEATTNPKQSFIAAMCLAIIELVPCLCIATTRRRSITILDARVCTKFDIPLCCTVVYSCINIHKLLFIYLYPSFPISYHSSNIKLVL